jgi:hypothetical protein
MVGLDASLAGVQKPENNSVSPGTSSPQIYDHTHTHTYNFVGSFLVQYVVSGQCLFRDCQLFIAFGLTGQPDLSSFIRMLKPTGMIFA